MKKLMLFMLAIICSGMTVNAQNQVTMAFNSEGEPYKEATILAEKFRKSSNQEFKGLFANGFFIDAIAGIGPKTVSYPAISTSIGQPTGVIYVDQMVSASVRLGSKWYLSKGEKFRTGIQAVWLRLGTLVPTDVSNLINTNLTQWLTCAPLNVGSTNLLAFNDDIGLEMNFNIGLNANASFTTVSSGNQTLLQFGLMINPVVKFRYKKLAVGLDFAFTHGMPGLIYESARTPVPFPYNTDVFQVALTVGGKF